MGDTPCMSYMGDTPCMSQKKYKTQNIPGAFACGGILSRAKLDFSVKGDMNMGDTPCMSYMGDTPCMSQKNTMEDCTRANLILNKGYA